jgi:hypothetical protein
MKDRTFIIITILFLLVCYLGNDNILKRSNEVYLQNEVNILRSKEDSLKRAYFDLEIYSIKLTEICDKYKSSRESKRKMVMDYKTLEL